MNSVLDSQLDKIGLNEFVQTDAFREEQEKVETEPVVDITLDDSGNPVIKGGGTMINF